MPFLLSDTTVSASLLIFTVVVETGGMFLPQKGQNLLYAGMRLPQDLQNIDDDSAITSAPQKGQNPLSSGMSLLHF